MTDPENVSTTGLRTQSGDVVDTFGPLQRTPGLTLSRARGAGISVEGDFGFVVGSRGEDVGSHVGDDAPGDEDAVQVYVVRS